MNYTKHRNPRGSSRADRHGLELLGRRRREGEYPDVQYQPRWASDAFQFSEVTTSIDCSEGSGLPPALLMSIAVVETRSCSFFGFGRAQALFDTRRPAVDARVTDRIVK